MRNAAARSERESQYRASRPDEPRLRLVDEEPPLREEGRRTITITGHPVPPRRRRSPAQAQIVARPDRVALWAVLLGVFLVIMAAATAHAAPL
jgi:hypothetical protein